MQDQAIEILWLTWEKHKRSRVLADHFNCQLVELISEKRGVARYTFCIKGTIQCLRSYKPKVLIVQNPSMFLALLSVLVRPFFTQKLIIDRHTNFKFDHRHSNSLKWLLFRCFSKYTIRKADITIVTNNGLARIVKKLGGTPFVLQDKIPEVNRDFSKDNLARSAGIQIFFVCSFGNDEPVKELVDVYIENNYKAKLVVSGNWRKKFSEEEVERMPKNIVFSGYVSDDDYNRIMKNSDGVVVLTKNEFTLNCGAYEAISMGKPLLLANTLALKGYFKEVSRFANLDSKASIKAGLDELILDIENDSKREERELSIAKMKSEWSERARMLQQCINNL